MTRMRKKVMQTPFLLKPEFTCNHTLAPVKVPPAQREAEQGYRETIAGHIWLWLQNSSKISRSQFFLEGNIPKRNKIQDAWFGTKKKKTKKYTRAIPVPVYQILFGIMEKQEKCV